MTTGPLTQPITTDDVDTLAVTGSRGTVMHLARKRLRHGGADAAALCGRILFDVYTYPLKDEPAMPWPLCSRCAHRR